MKRSLLLSNLSLVFALLAVVIALVASDYIWIPVVFVALAGACLGAAVAGRRKEQSERK